MCGALRDLVPFLQFKKREKNTHGRVLLLVKLQAEACNFTKSNTPPWVFFTFLNCTNGTTGRKASNIALVIKASIRVRNRTQYTNHRLNDAVENQIYSKKSQYISLNRLFYMVA